jgi:hypothetical protein
MSVQIYKKKKKEALKRSFQENQTSRMTSVIPAAEATIQTNIHQISSSEEYDKINVFELQASVAQELLPFHKKVTQMLEKTENDL